MISWALAWSAVNLDEPKMMIFIIVAAPVDLFIVGAVADIFKGRGGK